MSRKFIFYAKIKNCSIIFNEKLPPGCVSKQEITFTPKKENVNDIWLIKAITEHMEKMMEDSFIIEIKEIK